MSDNYANSPAAYIDDTSPEKCEVRTDITSTYQIDVVLNGNASNRVCSVHLTVDAAEVLSKRIAEQCFILRAQMAAAKAKEPEHATA